MKRHLIKKKLFILLILIMPVWSHALREYLYPVALCEKNGKQKALLMYQKSVSHVELWEWDPVTYDVQKALLSSYTPAGLRILPNNVGFSFLDNGRIRIKEFAQRSPRSINIYEPFYDISVVEWADSEHCFFSAKQEAVNALFCIDITTTQVTCLAKPSQGVVDYLYPNIVDGMLFYIERFPDNSRTGGFHYRIMQAKVPLNSLKAIGSERIKDKPLTPLITDAQKIKVLDFDLGREALAFLRMETEVCGYVLTHPRSIQKSDITLSLDYYKIFVKDNLWNQQFLFSFDIPLSLLWPDSELRLYESLWPLLPHHCESCIYYVRSSENELFTLNCYDIASGSTNVVWTGAHAEQCLFAPLLANGKLYCGGTINEGGPPYLYFDSGGNMKCELLILRQAKAVF